MTLLIHSSDRLERKPASVVYFVASAQALIHKAFNADNFWFTASQSICSVSLPTLGCSFSWFCVVGTDHTRFSLAALNEHYFDDLWLGPLETQLAQQTHHDSPHTQQ